MPEISLVFNNLKQSIQLHTSAHKTDTLNNIFIVQISNKQVWKKNQ